MFKKTSLLAILLLLAACSKELEQKPTTPLIITTSNGEIRFNVEVAKTPEELQKGLMYRSELPLNNGMIFNIYPVRPIAMWMKNTKIPLDMIFVAPDATISMIKERAVPMSEDKIISRDPIRAVIELNAGQVKRHDIKVGDKVNHAILNNMTTLSDEPAPQKIIPGAPNTPNLNTNSPIIPKEPNAAVDGPVIPKGPNTAAPIMPKGPNAAVDGPVIPKGSNAAANSPIIPKGPNAPTEGAVIPKGPNAPAKLPVPSPM